MPVIDFAKGHGTRNDFVLVADPDGLFDLTPEQVRSLCDRRGGIGADGVLRAVRASMMPGWEAHHGIWFMDYRNADGSIAEMCGNGLRVFLRYLDEEGLISSSTVDVATRAGVRSGRLLPDGQVAVTMGPVRLGAEPVTVAHGGREWPALAVAVGNPHAVVEVEADQLDRLDLTLAPIWRPATAFPDGVNVEFVVREGNGRLRLRVHERGVGETESCGTGVVAAAAALGDGPQVTVTVPGGTLAVDLSQDIAMLTGPAEIVARGVCTLPG